MHLDVYIHVYKHTPIYNFPHCGCFIKDVDLFMRSTHQPGIRAWKLPAIRAAPNDRKSEDNTPLEHRSSKRETSLCHRYTDTLGGNNCLQMVFTASYQNPNSLLKDNAFRVTLLLSHALMDMKWNKQTVSESSPSQSAGQHKEWVILLGCEVSQISVLQLSETNWETYCENKGRKRKGEFAGVWQITFSVSAWLFRSSFTVLQTKCELDLKLLEIGKLGWWPSLLLLWFY